MESIDHSLYSDSATGPVQLAAGAPDDGGSRALVTLLCVLAALVLFCGLASVTVAWSQRSRLRRIGSYEVVYDAIHQHVGPFWVKKTRARADVEGQQ